VFEVGSQGQASSALKIPISGPMFKRIWPDTIRATVFHVLSAEDIYALKKLEGGKKTISAFFSMMSRYLESGIAGGGGVVAELEADILVSAKDDIMSKVDKKGRRWVSLDWFANAVRTGPKFGMVEKEFSKLKENLVRKYVDRDQIGDWREVWKEMKHYLKGDGKKLGLVIKDYFDGVEKILKRHEDLMGSIFYSYAKSKRQTDNAWDEQIVNNIEITKVHIIDFTTKAPSLKGQFDATKDFAYVAGWPMKVWDATETMDLEVYTRQVAQAEVRTR
jgi:hypothetical protein